MGMRRTFIKGFILATIGIQLCFTALHSQSWKEYPYSPEGSVFTFPRDEGLHPGELAEWWYSAGHLYGKSSGTHYSFMLTYISYEVFGFDGYRMMVLCNEDTGEFYYETVPLFYTYMDTLSLDFQTRFLNDSTDSWSTRKDPEGNLVPFEYEISARGEHGKLELSSVSLKPPLILGDSGIFHQGSDSYTYYYSLTENEVDGKLDFKGIVEEVTGTIWIDRQYGNFNTDLGERYEWFYVNLSNGMDLNIANIFSEDRKIPDSKEWRLITAYVDSVTQYSNPDFDVERLAYSYMPDSLTCYSQKWHVVSEENQLDLIISTVHHHTEVQGLVRFYEGSVTVSGTVKGVPVEGRGFAELLVHYEPPRINFTAPSSGLWNDSIPISWHLQDPDDGRPVLYDLEYSTDHGINFAIIESGMEDTIRLWENPPLNQGDSVWFKLTAYSVDTTLVSDVTTEALIYSPWATDVKEVSGTFMTEQPIKLYPNPASSILYIESELDLLNVLYEIIDNMGRVVLSDRFNHNVTRIDLENLSTGYYVLSFLYKDGQIRQSFLIKN